MRRIALAIAMLGILMPVQALANRLALVKDYDFRDATLSALGAVH